MRRTVLSCHDARGNGLEAAHPPIVEAPSAAQAAIHAPAEDQAHQVIEHAAPANASDALGSAPRALVIEGDFQHHNTTLVGLWIPRWSYAGHFEPRGPTRPALTRPR